jgi:DNA polymerase sigma
MAKNEQEFNVKLVEAVELYPCLYNYKLPEYSRRDITENAWAKVAQQVNETGKYFIFFIVLYFLFILFYYLLARQIC